MTLRELMGEVNHLFHQWLDVLLAPSTWLDIPIAWAVVGVLSYSFPIYGLIVLIWVTAVDTSARVSLLRKNGASWFVVLIHNTFVYLLIHLIVLVAATGAGIFTVMSILAVVGVSNGEGAIYSSGAIGFGFGYSVPYGYTAKLIF